MLDDARTTSNICWPLRLTAPAALVLFVSAATWWELYSQRTAVTNRIEADTVRNLMWTMTRLAADLERAARQDDTTTLQEEISGLAENRAFTFAALVDESGIVLNSMRIADVGKVLNDILPSEYQNHTQLGEYALRNVKRRLGGQTAPAGDGRVVLATYPIVLGTRRGELRPTRIGMLVVLEDFSDAKARALRAVNRLALGYLGLLSAFALGLGAFFHLAVTRRLARLASVAKEVGAGNMTIRTGITGSDEIAELARSIDQMVVDKSAAEQQRAETEMQLHAVFNAAIDAIITIDERGNIQSVNRATERLFGYKTNELLGNNIKMLMPESYANDHDSYLSAYLTTGERKIIGVGREVDGQHKDGTTFPIDLSVSEVQIGDRRLFLGIARDVRERKKAEQHLANLGRILEQSLNEIFIFDAETLKFRQVNRGARNNLGYSMEELRGLTPVDIKPEFTHESFSRLLEPLVRGDDDLLVFETVHERQNGSRYNVDVHLQKTSYQGRAAFVAIIVDITEKKRVESDLRQRDQAVATGATAMVFADLEGNITYVNRAFLDMWGFEHEDEVLGRSNAELSSSPEDIREVMQGLRDQGEWVGERLAKRKDGSLFEIKLSASVVTDDGGNPISTMASFVDISDRVRAERELAELNTQLETRVRERTQQLEEAQEELVRQEKLATLGQLAGGVAHEIRNPLGVIKNGVYYLTQTQTDCDRETAEALAEIARGLSNSERIISELLDYATKPAVDVSTFSFQAAIDNAMQMVRIPNGVNVVPGPRVAIRGRGDQGQIERLLANLIQNATQAMPNGGEIAITCSAVDGQVITEVTDTGIGIPEDEHEKIFEPLFTKRAKGIGLGLALCRRYAELNGGELSVQSKLGHGSSFKLTLPLAE